MLQDGSQTMCSIVKLWLRMVILIIDAGQGAYQGGYQQRTVNPLWFAQETYQETVKSRVMG